MNLKVINIGKKSFKIIKLRVATQKIVFGIAVKFIDNCFLIDGSRIAC